MTTAAGPYYGSRGPNVVYQQGPHTRVYITKRSWLDAGVEVLPGDRKFTDYAFPPEIGYPSFARENNNRPIDRQPLNPPSDLGGIIRRLPALPGLKSVWRVFSCLTMDWLSLGQLAMPAF